MTGGGTPFAEVPQRRTARTVTGFPLKFNPVLRTDLVSARSGIRAHPRNPRPAVGVLDEDAAAHRNLTRPRPYGNKASSHLLTSAHAIGVGMDIRDKLMAAAADVYAEAGYRGATTRRIAQVAGVNEVTLFRHFGSKDALVLEALRSAADGEADTRLPSEPARPEQELLAWARVRSAKLHATSSLLRKAMGEIEEHPEIAECARRGRQSSMQDLSGYLERLRARGLATADFDPTSAATLLMGAIFAEAIGRDVVPELYKRGVDATLTQYVRLLLRAIGVKPSRKAPAHTRS